LACYHESQQGAQTLLAGAEHLAPAGQPVAPPYHACPQPPAAPAPTLLWRALQVTAASSAPLTLVNGVLLYPSMGPKGTLHALDAASGRLLSKYDLGASSNCGPAVVDGVIYTGSGYKHGGLGYGGNTFYALTVPSAGG